MIYRALTRSIPHPANNRCAKLLIILLALVMSACNDSETTTVLKLAHGLDQTHPVHSAVVFMGDRLSELSNGSMRIDIYSSGQLGDERELLELLQIGSLAMTKASASPMESFIPAFKIFSLPYVFRNREHLWSILEGPIGNQLLTSGDAMRLRGLAFYDTGSRNFYTKNSVINSPADLQGLKIRVQASQTSIDMVRTLGGAATPIPWGELYSALQQGVVDGAENNLPSYQLSNQYQVAPYLNITEHAYVPDVLIIGLPVWNSLSLEQQQWVQQAAKESAQFQKQLWQQATDSSLEFLAGHGVIINRPDKLPFMLKTKPMLDRYRDDSIGELINRIEKN